jgi:hypothetical protein
MRSLSLEHLGQTQPAVIQDHLVGIAPLVVGIVVVGLLIAAVTLGFRRREKDPRPDREHPQPRAGAWQTRQEHDRGAPADHGPGHQEGQRHDYESQRREPDPIPRDGMRHLPHALKGFGNEGTREAGRGGNTWDPGEQEDPGREDRNDNHR